MTDLTLIKPSEEYIDEIRAYRQEFDEAGEKVAGVYGSFYGDVAEWIVFCRNSEHKNTLPNWDSPYFTAHSIYLLANKNSKRIIGNIMLRYELNEALLEKGGHIGFSIRPSERQKGYAKRCSHYVLINTVNMVLKR